jgi:hypothetical protein
MKARTRPNAAQDEGWRGACAEFGLVGARWGRDTRTPERIVKAFWCRGGEKMPPSLCLAFGVLRQLFDLPLNFLNHFFREIAGKENHAIFMAVRMAHFCRVGIFNHQG